MQHIKTKFISAAAAIALASSGLALMPGCAEGKGVHIILNGEEMNFDVNPKIENGTTLVPMRAVFEALGADVSWNGGNNTVTAVKNGKTVTMQIGSTSVNVNGEAKEISAPPVIENGRTLVPLRVIGEALGVTVDWDSETYTVTMTKEQSASDDAWKENTGEINLSAMSANGSGISIDGKVFKITKGGDFTITGSCSDGMIYVNTDESVKLRLCGVNLTNIDGPAIFFDNVKKGFITISKDTENYITDGETYSVDAKGAIFSNDDLEIKGSGSLTVTANYSHGIASDDKIKIEEGTINITAENDGIHANDGITIQDGNIKIKATGDGIQSDGYVEIEGGTVEIETDGVVEDSNPFGGKGGFDFGGGQRSNRKPMDNNQPPEMPNGNNQPPEMPNGDNQRPEMPNGGFGNPLQDNNTTESASSKGIKAETNLIVKGGSISVNSTDHCLHSTGTVFIKDGTMTLSSEKKKGISAHQALIVEGGKIDITKSTEGIESKGTYCINGGTISVNATDDGLNAGGTSGRDVGSSDEHSMYINGGYIYVNANGDGVDSNGVMFLSGGTVIVNGPTNNGNGALDSGGRIIQQGGTLIAVGSSGMAEYPDNSSSQPSICYNLSQNQNADTIIRIEAANGEEILTYKSPKAFQSIVYSSDKLQIGSEYNVYVGGEYTGGTAVNGVLSDGSYTPSSAEPTSIKLESMSTSVGGGQRFGGGFGRGGR